MLPQPRDISGGRSHLSSDTIFNGESETTKREGEEGIGRAIYLCLSDRFYWRHCRIAVEFLQNREASFHFVVIKIGLKGEREGKRRERKFKFGSRV